MMDIMPAGLGEAADTLVIGFFASSSLTFQAGSSCKRGTPVTGSSFHRAKCNTPGSSNLGFFISLYQFDMCAVIFLNTMKT